MRDDIDQSRTEKNFLIQQREAKENEANLFIVEINKGYKNHSTMKGKGLNRNSIVKDEDEKENLIAN